MTERKYKGILAKKLFINIFGAADKKRHAQYKRDCEARDEALFAEFGIDPSAADAWRELAFALCERHVPAYGSLKRGRPPENTEENFEILLRWQQLVRGESISNIKACRRISEERGLSFTKVQNLVKTFKHSSHYMPILQLIQKLERKHGREKVFETLHPLQEPDREQARYIDAYMKRLRRPPYE